jgi:hypothetical protein
MKLSHRLEVGHQPEILWEEFLDVFLSQDTMLEKINYLVELAQDFGIYVSNPDISETVILHDTGRVSLVVLGKYEIRYGRRRSNNTLKVSMYLFSAG